MLGFLCDPTLHPGDGDGDVACGAEIYWQTHLMEAYAMRPGYEASIADTRPSKIGSEKQTDRGHGSDGAKLAVGADGVSTKSRTVTSKVLIRRWAALTGPQEVLMKTEHWREMEVGRKSYV